MRACVCVGKRGGLFRGGWKQKTASTNSKPGAEIITEHRRLQWNRVFSRDAGKMGKASQIVD